MGFGDSLCDRAMYERLLSHDIMISEKVKGLKKSEALALIGQSIFNRFVSEFSKIWKE